MSISFSTQSSSGGSAPKSMKPPRILLAEAPPGTLLQGSIRKLLPTASLHCVANGLDVLRAVRLHTYDLLFITFELPVMNGEVALRILRQDNRFNHLTVIGVSALSLQNYKGNLNFSIPSAAVPFQCIVHPETIKTMPKELASMILDFFSRKKNNESPYEDAQICAVQPVPAEEAVVVFDPLQNVAPKLQQIEPQTAAFTPMTLEDREGRLAAMPGFSYHTALERVVGNVDLYVMLLGELKKSLEPATEEFAAFQQSKQYTLLLNHVHTLKGVSGNVGAQSLYEGLVRLETEIKVSSADDPRQADFLARFQCMVHSTLDVLSTVLGSAAKSQVAPAKSAPSSLQLSAEQRLALAPLFNQIFDLIQQCDTAALDLLEDLRQHIGNEQAQVFRPLGDALDSFNFDNAAGLLKKLAQEGGVELE